MLRALLLGVLLASCASARPALPDYSEYLVAGVDPPHEADRVVAHLARAGFVEAARAEVSGVVALAFLREADQLYAVRVVGHRGVTIALEASPGTASAEAAAAMRGTLALDPRSGGDLDGNGTLDVLVVRREAERTCWLVLGVTDEGEAEPLVVDAADLDDDVCIEDLRDVNDDGTIEVIVGVWAEGLARSTTPRAELPLERDESGTYRRVPPAVAFVTAETQQSDAALAACRAATDAERCYTLAVERALFQRVLGRSVEAQVAAFDEATTGTVWPEELVEPLTEARSRIALGLW